MDGMATTTPSISTEITARYFASATLLVAESDDGDVCLLARSRALTGEIDGPTVPGISSLELSADRCDATPDQRQRGEANHAGLLQSMIAASPVSYIHTAEALLWLLLTLDHPRRLGVS
jgi:hypothetical protein